MVDESPFLLVKVECPVCKTINEFEQMKVGAYVEEERDTDFCPSKIKWRVPKYDAYNPLVFFAATCESCYYTRELTNSYKDWKGDNAFRSYRLKTIKARHLEEMSSKDSVVRRLGERSSTKRNPNEAAIAKLHLAVYDELLSEHPSQLDLGRFYLRIAWVFRGLGSNGDPTELFISGLIRELSNKQARVKGSLTDFNKHLDALVSSVDSHFDSGHQIPAEYMSRMLPYKEQYENQLQEIGDAIKQAGEQIKGFGDLVSEYRGSVLGETATDGPKSPEVNETISVLLRSLQDQWNGAVASEQEAIEKAIFYYKAAYASGQGISPGPQQIQASYLIAELSRRIGDHDGAREFFTSTIKSGQEFIYQNRRDQSRIALARKILELAIEQGRSNLAASKPA